MTMYTGHTETEANADLDDIIALIRGGVSANNGDNSVNVQVGLSSRTQRFQSPFTHDNTVTPISTNAQPGDYFDILREAGATGANVLIVAAAVPKNLAVGQGCRLMFSGGGWFIHSSWSI